MGSEVLQVVYHGLPDIIALKGLKRRGGSLHYSKQSTPECTHKSIPYSATLHTAIRHGFTKVADFPGSVLLLLEGRQPVFNTGNFIEAGRVFQVTQVWFPRYMDEAGEACMNLLSCIPGEKELLEYYKPLKGAEAYGRLQESLASLNA